MKNIVILFGELFVCICVCFDVVIYGYVLGIKKIFLKECCYCLFDLIVVFFIFCLMKKG